MKHYRIIILLSVALAIIVLCLNSDTINFVVKGLPGEPVMVKEYIMPKKGNVNNDGTEPFPAACKYRLYAFDTEQELTLVWMRKTWYGWKLESKHSQNKNDGEYAAAWKIYSSGQFTYINQDLHAHREMCQKVIILCETSKIDQWKIKEMPQGMTVSAVSTDFNIRIGIGEEIPGYTLIEATTYDIDNYNIENMEQCLCEWFGLEYAAVCISDIRE